MKFMEKSTTKLIFRKATINVNLYKRRDADFCGQDKKMRKSRKPFAHGD